MWKRAFSVLGRKAMDFCALIMYSSTLLNWLISQSVSVESLQFSAYSVMSFANSDN